MVEIPTKDDIQKLLEPIVKQLENIQSGIIQQTYLTTDELAEYLKTSPQQIRKMISKRTIPNGTKVTGKWLFKKSDIDKWLLNK